MNTCTLRRLVADLLPNSRIGTTRLERHAAQCPACRRQLDGLAQLDAQLTRQVPPQNPSLPEPLRQRLLLALAEAGDPAQPRPAPGSRREATIRRHPVRWTLPLAAAAACVLLLLRLQPDPDSGSAPAAAPALALDLTTPIDSIRPASGLPQLAEAMHEPLARELASSIGDGRRLLAGMVRGTLPDSAATLFMRETGLLPADAPHD